MITDEELTSKIDEVCRDFQGQLDDLYATIGIVVMGRRYGSRVMRLVSSRRHWGLMVKLFGDPNLIMRERDVCTHKSIGLEYIDKVSDYWEVIKGHSPIPKEVRKTSS